jgi:hypothetical protein
MESQIRKSNGFLTDRAQDLFDTVEKDIASLDIGWAKAALYFRSDLHEHFGHGERSRRMQSLLRIHEQLLVYKRRFEDGDTLSLLNAIAMCADENLPLPTWLALAYRAALGSFLGIGGVTSLDTTFFSKNLPTNTAKAAASAKQDWQLAAEIYRATWEVAKDDPAITSFDVALSKALVNRRFGTQKTKARALFLKMEKSQHEFLGYDKSKSFSRFLAIRRKA